MRIALLAPGYPSSPQPYNWTFVHARAKAYRTVGHQVAAFTVGSPSNWTFEGVPARQLPGSALAQVVEGWRPDVLALHGPYFRLIKVAEAVSAPRVVWVHGHEVLWHWGGFRHGARPLTRALRALKTPARLVWQWAQVRRFLRRSGRIVFVSEWMRRAASAHTLTAYPQAVVIPNPVDTTLFKYVWQPSALSHGITIRSLNSKKYGIDLAIRGIACSQGADLTVVGTGSLEGQLRKLASRLDAPVRFASSGLPHEALSELHSHYGFFVAASRVEAQGVAMCEAMASGLPVVATRIGGIPEFVVDGESGTLVPPLDWRALGDAITRLVADPKGAAHQSEAARALIERTCAAHVIAPRELDLLRDASHR